MESTVDWYNIKVDINAFANRYYKSPGTVMLKSHKLIDDHINVMLDMYVFSNSTHTRIDLQ